MITDRAPQNGWSEGEFSVCFFMNEFDIGRGREGEGKKLGNCLFTVGRHKSVVCFEHRKLMAPVSPSLPLFLFPIVR